MAQLRDEHRPSQRDIEGVLEDLDPIYRGLDDCEDSDDLESYASTLDSVITRLTYLAADWHRYAQQAEDDNLEDCPECGTLCTEETRDNFGGYCSAECEDTNN